MFSRRSAYHLGDGVLFNDWRDVPMDGWYERWPNFEPWEFASPDNGEFYLHTRSFDAIQQGRYNVGRPLRINSAHRSRIHNLAVEGVPDSAHLFVAFDVSTRGHDRAQVFYALKAAGFKSFGFYMTFIHVDLRPGRVWYSNQAARKIWQPIYRGKRMDMQL